MDILDANKLSSSKYSRDVGHGLNPNHSRGIYVRSFLPQVFKEA